ncbi:hypothetical protein DFH06DRAFT_1247920 [Mycena polygramma]|nr:hypothetical protein DFH06DRAFT_1247920 [Mycena polygramma]
MDPLLPNKPLDASQGRIVRSQLASTLAELSTLEQTLLKLSLVSAELRRQKNRALDSAAAMRNAHSPIHAAPTEILVEVFRMCRDSSLESPVYSILAASQAPLVLTHVSARWRSICLSTSDLWHHFRICFNPTSILPSPTIIRRLLARSGAIPLHVGLATDIAPQPESLGQVFTALLQDQGRFQSLHIDLAPSDLPSAIWHQNGTFPLLTCVDICVQHNADYDFGHIIRLFATTPCVQTVKITGSYVKSAGWASVFRWSRLTEVDLEICLDPKTGREILMQCARVQKCTLKLYGDSDSGMQHPREICRLLHLNDVSFDFDCSNESTLRSFFEVFAFPSLTHLDITSHICYGYNDTFLAAFTCGSDTSLALPHLRFLIFDDEEFDPAEALVTGPAVLRLVESLSQRTGENTAFPALEHIELTFNAPPFDPAIEERICEISSASSVLSCIHNELD